MYPLEVEQVRWGHPAVGECAVIGVPNPDWGEEVKAVVELKPGMTVIMKGDYFGRTFKR